MVATEKKQEKESSEYLIYIQDYYKDHNYLTDTKLKLEALCRVNIINFTQGLPRKN